MDEVERDAREAAKAFRTGSRPLAIAFVANFALAALCLGLPYYRGHARAKASIAAFSRFAACLLDGEAQPSLGLGMPQGERAHFASQMMRGAKDWPERCNGALRAIAPEDATFLWPSVKAAGGDVRIVVAMVERELAALARLRSYAPEGRVPERPLLALAKLRAALALLAKAADADGELDRDAIAFKRPAALAEPARLPIVAGSSAALDVWASEDGLYALALDGRGLSFLHVEGGKIDHRRFRRSSQLRAALRTGGQPLIVWATSRAKCENDEHHCLRRATGVARLDADAEQLPNPIWLGGHPAGRADRTLRPSSVSDEIDLLALADAEGAVEVRRFKPVPPAQENAPPLAPLARFAVPGSAPADAQFLPGQPAALAYAVAGEVGLEAFVLRYEAGAAPVSLGTLRGAGGFLSACDAGDARFVAFGSASELAIARVTEDGAPLAVLPATPLALGEPLHPEDPAHDRLRLLCGAGRAHLIAATSERKLITLACGADACERGPELAEDVATFDATMLGDAMLLAYSRSREPQLVVVRLDAKGAPLGKGQTPAACWDPAAGMCGQPTLVADAGRLLLCARDGSDLLALESSDQGEHWNPVSGLQVSRAISTDPSAPMQQHRLRKGLD